jgi:citrate lyase beta subunit
VSVLDELCAELDRALGPVDEALARRYPGEPAGRQPVHTAYVAADRYRASTAYEWGAAAQRSLDEHAPSPAAFAAAAGVPERVYGRVQAKLDTEPVEDLRIDFEDGYGVRPDEEEDATASAAALALGQSVAAGTAPPFVGLRCKSLEASTRRRAVRTLDTFLMAYPGNLPAGFVVTLPKVSAVEQVAAMATLCGRLETTRFLPAGRLRFEVQVETPQAVLGPDGTATVARLLDAADGRCVGLHYGTYDYSASLGIAPGHQSLHHPAADHAKAVMQVAAAGTGIRLSDGSTNILPVGGRDGIHTGWRLHAALVRRSLELGFYQGWDLHPAQLPTRYAATYAFFDAGLDDAVARLSAYASGSRGAGPVADEPATVAALRGFLTRGVRCGAVNATALPAAVRDLVSA